jgi:hypothetical protein
MVGFMIDNTNNSRSNLSTGGTYQTTKLVSVVEKMLTRPTFFEPS